MYERESTMKWNVLLVVVSLVMLLLVVAVGSVEHMMQAEAIAEQLAPRIGVDEDRVRMSLEAILRHGRTRRTAVYAGPLIVLSCLLAARLMADAIKGKNRRSRE